MKILLSTTNAKGVTLPVLKPFLETISPALSDRATEIRIETWFEGDRISKLLVDYRKNGDYIPLIPNADFQPFVASSRVRLLTGMSINPLVPKQTGTLQFQVGESHLNVEVLVIAEDGHETIMLRPQW